MENQDIKNALATLKNNTYQSSAERKQADAKFEARVFFWHELLSFIFHKGGASRSEVIANFTMQGLTSHTVESELDHLKATGHFKNLGVHSPNHYQIKDAQWSLGK